MNVLIYEGNPTTAMDLWSLLHEEGHTVCGIARDPAKCMAKMARLQPDVVIVDDVLRSVAFGPDLVEDLARSGVPVVIVTDQPQSERSCSRAGAILRKPLTQVGLASAMARVARGGEVMRGRA